MKVTCDFCGRKFEMQWRRVQNITPIFRLAQISPDPDRELSKYDSKAICVYCLKKLDQIG